MAASNDDQLDGDWGKLPAELFNLIAQSLDVTVDVRLAACSKTLREINHIATGTAPSLNGELLPPHGSSSGDEDGGGDGSGVDGEAFRGTSPLGGCRNRDSCPPDLGFAMTAARNFSRIVASS
ncbi:hypothetical protein QYE76_030868 [Lolium multiflorum]|uniref:Uncharacterized protein n=1 Tax=Lolium multiflorum TaxID=4521 RepID=A0AAD8QRM3_LOLMU|nr:hypothetical protein QYE76_030868 [Lolium multiflorum]